jgi:HK97 family phage major capsid protein
VIRNDLAEVMALRQDLAFLRGTGTSGEPKGLRNVSGLTAGATIPANGKAVDFAMLKEIVAKVRDAGAAMRRPGFIFAGPVVSALDRLVDANGHFYSESDNLIKFDQGGTRGTVVGVPFIVSRQIPVTLTQGTATNATEIFFGDWSECFVGENLGLTIEASGEASYTPDGGTTWISAFQNRQKLFRACMAHDVSYRRPTWFSVTVGALV